MKYVCTVCGYVYDEEVEGVPFSELPDTWTCPLCQAPKDLFEPMEPEKTASNADSRQGAAEAPVPDTTENAEAPDVEEADDMREMSAGELSVLFSNLARGCEKQYHAREAALFMEIAAYFEKITPSAASHDLEALSALILKDLNENYPAAETATREAGDRGACRALTWGSKVTKIQQTLINRYRREGEAFLAHTNVWVCTVCGFIYVGENPPDLCPVCKVPAWKFEKIKGGKAV